jgi:hypothetical protein
MQQLFRDAVLASGAATAIVTGIDNERLERAVDAIDALLLLRGD